MLFDDMPVKLYIRFNDKDEYEDNNKKLMSILNMTDEGQDSVIVYLRQTKQQKKLRIKITASEALLPLKKEFGDDNVVTV